jgi:CRP-like cAMP-binding protein
MSDISTGEFERFSAYLQTYKRGAPIIVEGIQDDKGVFLLRMGKVGVFKNQGDGRGLITTIDAVNFFGEMALLSSGPRTVTIEAMSEQVTVYSFRASEVQALMNDPKWGYMLCTRLVMNLKNSNDQIADLAMQNKTLKKDLQQLKDTVLEIIIAVHSAHKALMTGTVLNAREYQYLTALNKLLENLLVKRLPGFKEKLTILPLTAWRHLNDEGVIPALLFTYLQDVLKPGDKNK